MSGLCKGALQPHAKCTVRFIFDKLERQMGTYDFQVLFDTILTDRGSEFVDPDALETGIHGHQRSNIYYCDPMRSGQKGGIDILKALQLRPIPPDEVNLTPMLIRFNH